MRKCKFVLLLKDTKTAVYANDGDEISKCKTVAFCDSNRFNQEKTSFKTKSL